MPLSVPASIPSPRVAVERGAREVSCAHCGLPVPAALVDARKEQYFCCSGCETVHNLLQGAGLEGYYSFREQLGEVGQKIESSPARGALSEFDTEAFQKLYCDRLPSGMTKVELLVEGVHCAACVWLLERLPRLESSVVEARLDMARSSLTIVWDSEQTTLSQIARTLAQMGYRPRPFRGKEAARMRRDELRSLMIRMGVAGAVAGNVMLMAFALYSGEVGIDESGTMDAGTVRFFEVLSFFVSLPALWAGSLFFRGAWSALRTRTPHMDLPIAIGILVGFVWGAYGALFGAQEIYFDSITALIFFLLVGRYLQRRHQLAAADAAELLHAVVPGVATVVEGENVRRASSSELGPGALVRVESGEVVPVDGVVRRGTSNLDKSLLSGESRPITVREGDEAEAGSLNLGSVLVIEATRAGAETRVARLMREVERALSTRTKLVGQADRIAGIFTVTVLFLSLAVAIYWAQVSGASAVEHALSLLIVACPCALGLATPLALSAAVSQAAKARQLIFSPGALEELARPADVVIDKTGTLTLGRLTVTKFVGDPSGLPVVRALEEGASHPVAHALRTFVEKKEGQPSADTNGVLVGPIRETPGAGLEALTASGLARIGSERFILDEAHISEEFAAALRKSEGADSPLLLSVAGEVQAIFWVGDRIRKDAARSLASLERRGHRLHLLSGDHPRTVDAVAEQLARQAGNPRLFSSARGGVSPEEKLAFIGSLREQSGSAVVMVGDGVNDTGALAAADVGISVKGAAEASRMSSDVYLSSAGVAELVALFDGAEATLRTIRRGIVFSLAYNAVGITCAALGIIGPLWAAVLMPLSSLTVVTNAYKSRMFRAPESP